MNNEKELQPNVPETADSADRRDALKKLGKYAAYVAPFTLLALSQKASAASGHGPKKPH